MNSNSLKFIQKKLEVSISVILLFVLHSEGSSPGRQGFHMIVSGDGSLFGSIGGGIMEHKLVELAKKKLVQKEKTVELKYQFHDKSHASNQSGMICSGHQIIALFPLFQENLRLFQRIKQVENNRSSCKIILSPMGVSIQDIRDQQSPLGWHISDEKNWHYAQALKKQKVIHIFGGGHVSLALSEVMRFLGFYIKVYEDRPNLNTLNQNTFCHEKHIQNYDQVGLLLNDCANDYVVIMTFGYRPDKAILIQLLSKSFAYIGMMGSKAKIKTLLGELESAGYPYSVYQHVHTPIGLDIKSETPEEIAISIAAQIIQKTNKKYET